MTMSNKRVLYGIFAIVVLVYAAIFPLLTVDTLLKVTGRASVFEAGNLLLLIYLELGRLITSIVGIGLAVYLLMRAASQPDARALALFLLFVTITYEKAFGGSGYPGDVQQQLVSGLLGLGVSRTVLTVLFGPQSWTLWPALAALLRFSVVFPRRLEPNTLDASGANDRRGMLRGSGVAGLDIGASFRQLSKRLLLSGALSVRGLTAFAIIMIAVHVALQGTAGALALVVIAAIAVCIAVTNVRAAYVAAEGTDRVRATWIAEGFVVAVFVFLISTALLALAPAPATRMLAFVLIMLLPAAVMACLTISVLDRGELDSSDAIHQTVRMGTIALAVAIVFGVLFTVLRWLAPRFGMSHALASLAAVVITAVGLQFISRMADRIRRRILERPEGAR